MLLIVDQRSTVVYRVLTPSGSITSHLGSSDRWDLYKILVYRLSIVVHAVGMTYRRSEIGEERRRGEKGREGCSGCAIEYRVDQSESRYGEKGYEGRKKEDINESGRLSWRRGLGTAVLSASVQCEMRNAVGSSPAAFISQSNHSIYSGTVPTFLKRLKLRIGASLCW